METHRQENKIQKKIGSGCNFLPLPLVYNINRRKKQMMDYRYIEQLLERYWQCQTTLEEETILRAFFAQEDVPMHLLRYRQLFLAEHEERQRVTLGDDFDRRMLAIINDEEPVKARQITLSQRFRPFFRAAAVIAIMITLGTGVGSGIVIDGKVVYGHDGFAGELGHTKIIRGENARLCGCGHKGCLEAYASATGVARTAREIVMNTNEPTLLRNLEPESITSKDVFDAAEQGDEVAKRIFDETGKMLGQKFADFVAFSAPEAIILFGGMTKCGHYILDPIVKTMNEDLMPVWQNKVKVMFSDLKEADAAVLGASALAWGE